MTREEDGTSFDPKTWAGGGGAGSTAPAPAAPGSDGASFDPKSWAPPPTESPQPAAPAASPAPAPPAGPTSPVLLAAAASALLLAGGGAAAFLTRQPPVAVVADAPAAGTPAATAAVAEPVNASRRTLVVAGADGIAAALAGSGLAADAAQAAARQALTSLGNAAGEIRLVLDLIGPDGARRMTRMEATRDDGAGVVLTARAEGGFAAETRQARLSTEVRVVRGEMDQTSFYSAAVTAGIDDTLIDGFANAFSFDFNFATDVHPGDIFEAAFERKVNDRGEAVGAPTLVYVSLTTQTKSKSLYRFLAPGDTEPGWFDGNGRSTVTALMRTPVDGARISSGFGMRFHPVLHFNKLHKGTDFAAPIGTAIYAAGTGTIEWAAMKGPNGNLTILKHDNGWQTYYLHQSMFMPGVEPGAHVNQGQKIGEIGTTGRSTGPHLHFELHVNGEPIDPMSIETTGTGRTLDGGGLAAFRKERDRIDVSRAAG